MPKAPKKTLFPFRIGFGYDIHRLEPGRTITLGGVRLKSRLSLVGHSDADVLLHAICDSLLGAAALGDIGKHFPNTDARYRGIPSLKLLAATLRAITASGYAVVNVDSTLILEAPKLGNATKRMESLIAKTLNLPRTSVSVKATTNERIGPLGRSEGCAAMAVSMITRV